MPVEFLFTSVPMVSVYADGRVITTGPMIEIYPPPALPNLRQIVLTEAGLQHVLDEVRNTGLFAESTHYDGPEVTDLPDTVFTFTDDGKTVVVSAYALGVDESMVPERVDTDAVDGSDIGFGPAAKRIALLARGFGGFEGAAQAAC